jgi:hypothetical protein
VKDIGNFPERLKPVTLRPMLTNLPGAINYKEIFELLGNLHLTIYTPTEFIHPSKLSKYLSEEETENFRKGRELGVQRLMSINLLKRMESSVHSFLMTVTRIHDYINATKELIDAFAKSKENGSLDEVRDLSGMENDFDDDDKNTDFFTVGKKVHIELNDMDYISWRRDMEEDLATLSLLISTCIRN